MNVIRETALQCVGRAVFFGSLAICCTMVGFAFSPVAAFRVGAVFTLIMAAILLWKSRDAAQRPPKTTEVWLYLDEKTRPVDPAGIFGFRIIMRDIYAMFAWYALMAAMGMFAASLALTLMGFKVSMT
ncbi:MAG: hypothetical protein WAT78_09455 [Rhizobiaceae bacterium]